VAIVGVGNLLLRDEGVGVQALEALREAGLGAVADLIDAGTAFLDAATMLGGYSRVIIIDAMRAGNEPGTVYRVDADEIESVGRLPMSLHGMGLAEALAMLRLAGVEIGDLKLFGIEPEDISAGMELSPAAERGVRRVVELLSEELLAGSKETIG